MHIFLDIEALRSYEEAGDIVKNVRRSITPSIKEGAMLLDIATLVEEEITGSGGRPAFPCTIAINETASHYTPSRDDERSLRRGDLVKVDFGACVHGYVADAAFTVEIGTREQEALIIAAKEALFAGIARIRPGVPVSRVGGAIHDEAASRGFHVLKDLLGHSLGWNCLHGGLTIPPYDDGSDLKIREGDVLAIEPFLTKGSGIISRIGGGNIYQLFRNGEIYAHGPEEKELLGFIHEHYGTFPFAERWLPKPGGLPGLLSSACVKAFPMMVEADGAPVAQAEATVIVEHDGYMIIT
ncbi:MAG TPA: type II methionyl aminopeptidase [Methanocella sp.]|uniref:type II methionyl aminopeptidase n=1 Tax=Methanocella sp. TaxID=2052833 RepID=UPI002C91130E|nr:type II methionyl aminopeptidase [Methanocella sp.]HTY90687.1 type II methionyl aminopeptidase [Methanocella sp.]